MKLSGSASQLFQSYTVLTLNHDLKIHVFKRHGSLLLTAQYAHNHICRPHSINTQKADY